MHRLFPIGFRLTTALSFAVVAFARNASAQGEVSVRVVAADSGRPPVQGAEASIPKLGRTATSDSVGRFSLKGVPPGEHLMVIRAIGFKSESSTVFIDRDEVVSAEVVMTRTTGTVLPERRVTARETPPPPPAKLLEFTERQKAGTGHFIDRSQLAKAEAGMRQTGDVISMVPGVVVRRGTNKIWVASGRAVSVKCAFCKMSVMELSQVDIAAGARPACFMDVYLDGALIYDSHHPENGLFDVNSIPPDHISGIEVYSSAAQVPAKYNRTGGACGVLLIWTR